MESLKLETLTISEGHNQRDFQPKEVDYFGPRSKFRFTASCEASEKFKYS